SRAVLESDRHRQAAGELAVHLAFRGARPDGAPRDQIRDELWADRVEKLRCRREPQLQHAEQERPRDAQATVDGETTVQVRIVDQPLPTHGGARLLEV